MLQTTPHSAAAQTPSVVVPRNANVCCINKLKTVLLMPHACYMIALLAECAVSQVLPASFILLPLYDTPHRALRPGGSGAAAVAVNSS